MFVDVALFVASDFLFPKVGVGFGHLEVCTGIVPMPEATVDKDDSAVFAQYDVGMAGESGMVEAIAEATGKEILAHKYLGACSLALYSSHAAVALLLCHLVHLAAKILINSDMAKKMGGFYVFLFVIVAKVTILHPFRTAIYSVGE